MQALLENLMQLQWVAGLIEGEGSFGVDNRKQSGYTPRVSVGMTDEDVIRKAHAVTGVGRVYGPYEVKRSNVGAGPFKPRYQWVTQGKQAAELMKGIYCFMGERRQGRIREILDGYDTYLAKKVSNGRK